MANGIYEYDITTSLLLGQQDSLFLGQLESRYIQENVATKVNETAQTAIGMSRTITSIASKLDRVQGKRIEKLTLADGSIYNGEVNDEGQPHGKGVIIYVTNDPYARKKYDGLFMEGKREGVGILTFGGTAEGQRYNGAFSNDALTGLGEMIWPNGKKYTGGWLNAKFHGYGTLIYPPDDSYERERYKGQFKEGLREGTGLLTWCGTFEGQNYNGQFKADKFDGQGVMTWPSGQNYTGQWANSAKNGHGTLIYAQPDAENRWKFVGEFAHGKGNGQGTLYYCANADGYTRSNQTGTWVDDKLQYTCCCVVS